MSRIFLEESCAKQQFGIYETSDEAFFVKRSYFLNIDTSLSPNKCGAVHCSKPGANVEITECCFDRCAAYSMGASFYLKTDRGVVQKSNSFGCWTITDIDAESGIGGRLENNENNLTQSTISNCSPHERYSGRSSFAIYYGLSEVFDSNLTNSRTTTNGVTLHGCNAGSGIAFLNVLNQKGQNAAGFETTHNSYLSKSNFVNNSKITLTVFRCTDSNNVEISDCIFFQNSKADVSVSATTVLRRCITDKYIWNCEKTFNCSVGVESNTLHIVRKYGCYINIHASNNLKHSIEGFRISLFVAVFV